MEYKTVTYLNNFPHPIHGSLQPMRLGGEMLINESNGETPQQAWDRMHKDACEWHEEKSREVLANSNSSTERVIKKEAPQNRISALIADIYTCTELKVLESYKLMVKKDSQLQAAYDQMFKKLSK